MAIGKFIPELYPNLHPVFIECRNGNAGAVRLFLESGLSVNFKDEHHASLIATSIEGGYLEIVKILISHGLDVNAPINRFGETPLLRALCEKHNEIVALLLSSGADPNLADQIGFSPLMSASANGDVDMIEFLMRHGADPNQVSERGRTPMIAAVLSDQVATIRWWLAHGANLEHRDALGSTALIIAAKGGKLDALQTLVNQGADILAEDKRGKTALDWAIANGHQKIVENLRARMTS